MPRETAAPGRHILTSDDIEGWRHDGYRFPLQALSEEDATGYARRLEASEAQLGPIEGNLRHKTHLLFTWANELVRNQRILDAVEDIIGPNILCWTSNLFMKDAHSPSFVSWHQDTTYWGLSPDDAEVTAWLALTPATVESGAMRFLPGSHQMDRIAHEDTFDENNLLTRGQVAKITIDEERTVDVVLKPGEFSLHHIRILHGSGPNTADFRRIGLAVRYIPTFVTQTEIARDSATLVRGEDSYGHFDLEPAPKADADEAARAAHAEAMARQVATYYKGTDKTEMRA